MIPIEFLITTVSVTVEMVTPAHTTRMEQRTMVEGTLPNIRNSNTMTAGVIAIFIIW